jgi:methyl-accepting chemotaxis protein
MMLRGQRLGLGAKLHAFTGLVLVGFLLATVVASKLVQDVRIGGAQYQRIRHYEVATRNVAVLQTSLAEALSLLMSFTSEDDALKRAAGIRNLQERTARIDEQFATAIADTSDEEARVELLNARATWLQFSDAVEREIVPALQAARAKDAMHLIRGVQQRRYDRFAEQLLGVVDGFQGRIRELEAHVATTVRTAVVGAVAMGLLLLAALFVSAVLLARSIQRPIAALEIAATRLAQGDLREQVEIQGTDEIGRLARSFQTMSEGLRAMTLELKRGAHEVDAEARQLLTIATQQSAMTAQQSSAIHETSTTATQIAQTSKQATDHASNVIEIAQRSEDVSTEGERVLDEVKHGIEAVSEQVNAIAGNVSKLAERTLQIGEIIARVKDVAEQSNVLALNAAIEASKAGEHGRGFAVVAAEMRNLAEQSKAAAAQVRVILGEIHAGTRAVAAATEEGASRANAAIGLSNSAASVIVRLAETIRDSSVAARQIANNTRQQTIGVDHIVIAIGDLSAAMEQSVAGTQSIENATTELSTVAGRLSAMLARYQV